MKNGFGCLGGFAFPAANFGLFFRPNGKIFPGCPKGSPFAKPSIWVRVRFPDQGFGFFGRPVCAYTRVRGDTPCSCSEGKWARANRKEDENLYGKNVKMNKNAEKRANRARAHGPADSAQGLCKDNRDIKRSEFPLNTNRYDASENTSLARNAGRGELICRDANRR